MLILNYQNSIQTFRSKITIKNKYHKCIINYKITNKSLTYQILQLLKTLIKTLIKIPITSQQTFILIQVKIHINEIQLKLKLTHKINENKRVTKANP